MPNRARLPFVAHVRALAPADWLGRAGDRFRRTLETLDRFATRKNIQPRDLADEAVDLAQALLYGKSQKDLASTLKDFAAAEKTKIEIEQYQRTNSIDERIKEADARLAELKVMDAEIDLFRKMKDLGLILRRDGNGNLTVLPVPQDCNLLEISNQGATPAAAGLD